MTNLQKLHKEATDLISDILDLKLGVGDIVEWKTYVSKKEQCKEVEYNHCVQSTNEWLHIGEKKKGTFKLIRKLITLSMVLEAFQKSEKNILTEELGVSIQLYDGKNNEIHFYTDCWHCDWILRKDNKDLSLFDQKNETVKFIIEVLK